MRLTISAIRLGSVLDIVKVPESTFLGNVSFLRPACKATEKTLYLHKTAKTNIMKQWTSYWLRMSLAAVAGLVVAVLLHYFWASDEKDLVYSIGNSVPIIAAVMLLMHFANMQRIGFDKMRLSYGWSLTVGALVLVVLDFLSYWLLCGTTPLKALVIGIVCPLIAVLAIMVFYRPGKKVENKNF